jgi:hypothetical protein
MCTGGGECAPGICTGQQKMVSRPALIISIRVLVEAHMALWERNHFKKRNVSSVHSL